ncbi:MAG: gamma-glutamylcyclotransferase family protein [Ethanoligenens sp.]
MNKPTLYIAYGSNLSLPQMACRCPTARVAGASEIKDYELLFRGGRRGAVATVEPLKGASVPVLLWKIQPADEQSLDRYEGYPHFYHKEILPVELAGKTQPAMVYIMNGGHPLGAPSDYYLQTIADGYKTAGFDTDFLVEAVEKSIRLAAEQEQSLGQGDSFELKWW